LCCLFFFDIRILIAPLVSYNGQPSYGGDRKIFEVKISTEPLGSLGSEASLLAEPSIKEIMRGTTL
jgi:hypothetical protein